MCPKKLAKLGARNAENVENEKNFLPHSQLIAIIQFSVEKWSEAV